MGWRDPENLNGAIAGYRIFYIHQNQTYFATLRSGTGAGEMITYVLSNLSKWKKKPTQMKNSIDHIFHNNNNSFLFSFNKCSEPYSEYKVTVKAFTWKNEGEASDAVTQRTDISGPSAPIVTNLTCNNLDALYLRWKRPLEYYNSIDFYIVSFRSALQHDYTEIKINASARHLETAVSMITLSQTYFVSFIFELKNNFDIADGVTKSNDKFDIRS